MKNDRIFINLIFIIFYKFILFSMISRVSQLIRYESYCIGIRYEFYFIGFYKICTRFLLDINPIFKLVNLWIRFHIQNYKIFLSTFFQSYNKDSCKLQSCYFCKTQPIVTCYITCYITFILLENYNGCSLFSRHSRYKRFIFLAFNK